MGRGKQIGDSTAEAVNHILAAQFICRRQNLAPSIMTIDVDFLSWKRRDGKQIYLNEVKLSLSRLNHGLPRAQAHPEVVQGTTDFHDPIPDALLPQAQPVFDDPTALHTAVDMLNP